MLNQKCHLRPVGSVGSVGNVLKEMEEETTKFTVPSSLKGPVSNKEA